MKAAATFLSLSFSFCCPVFESCLTFLWASGTVCTAGRDSGSASLASTPKAGLGHVQGTLETDLLGDAKGETSAFMINSFIQKCLLTTYYVSGRWGEVKGERWQGRLCGPQGRFVLQRKWQHHSCLPPGTCIPFVFHNRNRVFCVYTMFCCFYSNTSHTTRTSLFP